MNKTIIFPENWDEITPDQYAWLLKYMAEEEHTASIETIRVLFTDYILGQRRPMTSHKRTNYFALVEELSKSLDWLFRVENNLIMLNYDTTNNLIPKIGKLLGPLSHGSDLKFREYQEAVVAYNEFTETFEESHLNRLVGILYRPANKSINKNDFDGNRRMPFNRYHMARYIEAGKGVPGYLKWGIYLWFAAFCKYLLSGGIFIIDGKEISFTRIFKKGGEPVGTDIGMNAILFSLADTGTFGKVSETEDTELFRVLLKLLHDANMMDEIERKNKK